ncbi:MAG: hypothetical protein M3131_01525, partial [Actinomycetota bacterium]|nr:hypothetical protein [Actinomycetota bacterium]
TLMWRKVPESSSAHQLLGARLDAEGRLAPGVDAGAFAALRARAETQVRQERQERRAGGSGADVTLDDICARIPNEALRGITVGELADREVELERSILVPDLDVVELARWALEQGTRVVCVSDTCFSEPQVHSFLAAAPLAALPVERVFASSTRGVGKGDGLWRIVCDELDVRPAEVVHVGESPPADVDPPGAAGMRTVCFERCPRALARIIEREDRHAVAPLSPYHGDYGLTALRSKVLHRVECAEQPPELRPYWTFGAAALGPPLAGFAEWVQHRARQAGVSRVFCMMGSGGLLARMVNAAASSLDCPVEADPIWLSRQLCARASIVDGTAAELRTLLRRSTTSTMGEYCATLGLDIAEVNGFEGAAATRLDEPGPARRLVEQLTRQPDAIERVVAGGAELRGRIVRYLERLRPPGEDRLVVVDLGRGAPGQSLLDGLLRGSGSDLRTTGLYLVATDGAGERMPDGADVHGFLAHAGQPARPVEALLRSPGVLEQICKADHGSQVGLDSGLEPVLQPVEDVPGRTARCRAVQKGIAAFQRERARYRTSTPGALVALHEYGQDRLRSILVRALSFPTGDEPGLSAPSRASAESARYLEPGELPESLSTELHWPFDLAALYEEQLASAVHATATGRPPWKEPASAVEAGEVEVRCDRPYARGTMGGEVIHSVRIELADAPCVVRLRWVRLRYYRGAGGDPVALDFREAGLRERLAFRGMRPRGPIALVVSATDAEALADLRRLVVDDAHTAGVECGFAVLPLPAPRLRRRMRAAAGRLRERRTSN